MIDTPKRQIDLPYDLSESDAATIETNHFSRALRFQVIWKESHDGWSLCREGLRPRAMSFAQDNALGFPMIDPRRVRNHLQWTYHNMGKEGSAVVHQYPFWASYQGSSWWRVGARSSRKVRSVHRYATMPPDKPKDCVTLKDDGFHCPCSWMARPQPRSIRRTHTT